jgi:U3 small nucleolar RNA-associated protein 19
VANLVEVLLRMPQDPPASDLLWGGAKAEIVKPNGKESKAKKQKDPHATSLRLLGDCWTTLLQAALPRLVYRTVLVQLRKHVLPVLANPLFLADMLTDAFDMGGVVSLLALDGLFVLMTKNNLEYPKFYLKLYSLCKPHLLQAKHRGKFFTLLSLCLTSSHLPASLVAAFAKRLSRLALTANPPALVFLCTAIFNLLRRHPACRYLIHKPPPSLQAPTSGLLVAPVVEVAKIEPRDPFLAEEEDPALCQATLSSLWEMQSLTHHYCPQVVRAAKELFADNALKSKDLDVQATVEHTYLSLIESELEWRKNQPTPLTYENPGSLFMKLGSESVFASA